jgi:hypothetical protein
MGRRALRWGGWALVASLAGVTLWAQDRPPGPPPPPPGDPRAAVDDLDLSAEQHAKVDPLVADYQRQQRKLRDDLLRQLRATLTPEQYQRFAAAFDHHPPGGDGRDDAAAPVPATKPAVALAPGERRVAVTLTGGHDTDRRDGGRPVVLVAAGMGVRPEVFRETFTHVHPAGAGSGGPTDAEARQNKAALLAGLSKYGVTDDRINTVSNYYRYVHVRGSDNLWRHRDALANAIVRDGKVVRFEVTDAGAGYTTPPAVAVESFPDLAATATLTFTTDLAKNGSIRSLTVSNDQR